MTKVTHVLSIAVLAFTVFMTSCKDENKSIDPLSDANVIAYYPFNNNIEDEGVNNNNYHGKFAKQDNKGQFIADRNGDANAAYYKTTTNSKVYYPNLQLGAGSFSISLWLKLDGTVSDGVYNILSKRAVCSTGNMIALDYNKKADSNYKNRLSFSLRSENDGMTSVIKGVYTDFDQVPTDWVHIVVTVDEENKAVSLFVDGESKHEEAWDAEAINVQNSAPFGISYSPCINIDGTKSYQGSIDDLLLINKVLTNKEIKKLSQE